MKRLVLMIIPVLICGMALNSCDTKTDDESRIDIITDINYPTTIRRLSEETLMRMRNDYAQRNPFFFSNINQFGFCAIVEGSYGLPVPPDEVFAEEEAIASVKEFVSRNPEYTGIKNLDDIHFERVTQSVGTNGNITWVLRTKNQTFNETEIMSTGFVFHTKYREVVGAWGRNFPSVYIPEKFNFTVEQAKSKLLGKEVIHLGWAGQYSLGKIKKEHLQEATTDLIIVPIITEEKIELRITWKIYLASLYYIYYIDVMTGKIIQEEPTIIA